MRPHPRSPRVLRHREDRLPRTQRPTTHAPVVDWDDGEDDEEDHREGGGEEEEANDDDDDDDDDDDPLSGTG